MNDASVPDFYQYFDNTTHCCTRIVIPRRLWTVNAIQFDDHIYLFDYRNDPKFSDKSVWANSADPDQTAPRGAAD